MYKYRIERKEQVVKKNILGGHSFPVYTYRWKEIIVSNDENEILSVLEKIKAENPRTEYRLATVGEYPGDIRDIIRWYPNKVIKLFDADGNELLDKDVSINAIVDRYTISDEQVNCYLSCWRLS